MLDRDPIRVLVAGGGVAALETVLALRALAGSRVAVTLLAPEDEFMIRAATVGEPFDRDTGRRLVLAELASEQHAELVVGRLKSVDAESHEAVTDDGRTLRYDVLIVAVGALPTEPLPGALTFRGHSDVADMRVVLDDLLAERLRAVVFAVPRSVIWSLPLYELALMTAALLGGQQADNAELTITTPEPAPLAMFGPAGAHAMKRLLGDRGIGLRTHARPARVEDGGLVLATGDVVPADRVITIPILEGPRLAGLPADMHGFMPVDRHGRVQGVDDVFAAGDITNFPLKQGGLAAQQADAVAEAVAALASLPMEPRPFHPVIRGLLLTGAESVYLRAEPGAASRPDAPVGVIPSAFAESDRPLWWPPAKVAGRYLAPYLATARATRAADGTLVDRPATRAPARLVEHQEALELTLALADADAAWGDHASALRALDAAELLADVLPSEYEAKRRAWHAVLSG